jgi:Baculovirus 11 kDa family
MVKKATQILHDTIGGRRGNSIIDAIQANANPTDGDQLSMFIENNRSLIKEFVLVICGFIIFILIIVFFTILVTVLLNQYFTESQRKEYETILLSNLDVRTQK